MNIGNLSTYTVIPPYYMGFMFEYIMQISLAFIHAHEQNLTHGSFNLSRVIAQKMEPNYQEASSNTDRSYIDAYNPKEFDCYNYFITNFEPWKVDDRFRKFNSDMNYGLALNSDLLRVEKEKYILISKLQDLQAFGNSIVEIMVGKNQEVTEVEATGTPSPQP